jgi:hypothetical protein
LGLYYKVVLDDGVSVEVSDASDQVAHSRLGEFDGLVVVTWEKGASSKMTTRHSKPHCL